MQKRPFTARECRATRCFQCRQFLQSDDVQRILLQCDSFHSNTQCCPGTIGNYVQLRDHGRGKQLVQNRRSSKRVSSE